MSMIRDQLNNHLDNWGVIYKIAAFFVPIIFSIVSLIYTYNVDKSAATRSFNDNGISNRPKIEFQNKNNKYEIMYSIRDKPMLDASNIEGLPVQRVDKFTRFCWDIVYSTDTNIRDLTIIPDLLIKNTGNSVAKIVAEIVADKNIGKPMLREQILDGSIWNKADIKYPDDFFLKNELAPGQMIPFREPKIISDINYKSEFTLHYLILYQNELGNLFDSYYEMKLKCLFELTDMAIYEESFTGKMQLTFGKVDEDFSSYMYSAKETDEIMTIVMKKTKLLSRP